uniref:Putative secreted protein n=1 Tax=Lutzomyia longipalpis TaxID=7200 RepID=A0A7G3ANA3_LUTLO
MKACVVSAAVAPLLMFSAFITASTASSSLTDDVHGYHTISLQHFFAVSSHFWGSWELSSLSLLHTRHNSLSFSLPDSILTSHAVMSQFSAFSPQFGIPMAWVVAP